MGSALNTTALIAAIFLAGCDDSYYQTRVRIGGKLCANNGGLDRMVGTKSLSAWRCKDGTEIREWDYRINYENKTAAKIRP